MGEMTPAERKAKYWGSQYAWLYHGSPAHAAWRKGTGGECWACDFEEQARERVEEAVDEAVEQTRARQEGR